MARRAGAATLVGVTATEPHVLVAYASKHGSTAEIADAIAAELRDHGIAVDCSAAHDVGSLDGYDAVVLGSAVYMKRWLRDARRLFRRQRGPLAALPFWIFSSGPCGPDPDPAWAEPAGLIRSAEELGVRDHVVFGGRLPLEPSGFIEKAMERDTPRELADRRDWDEIRAWAAGIAAAVTAGAPAPLER
jgi:menaquinone-dependent protoporphyrinogen oxidase